MRKTVFFPIVLSLVAVVLLWPFFQGEQMPDVAYTAGASGVGDPYFPSLGNGGYDAQHYTIDLMVALEENTISGTVTMDAIATQNLSRFNLDFAGFEIHQIQVDDAAAAFSRDQRELTIIPAQGIREGSTFTVAVTYSGVPGKGVTVNSGMPFARGWTRYEGGVYVASEPDGSSLWYPVNDHPTDKATYTLRITVANPYVVAANGELVGIERQGNQTMYEWENDELTASYLVTVNIGQLARVEDGIADDVPLRNYFPEHLAEQGARVFQHTDTMMRSFNNAFGAYPFDRYGAVVTDTSLPFALETQTLSLFGRDILRSSSADMVISHELAHSWFGNSISLATWRDIWLNEGFAMYATALWLEDTGGVAARDLYLRQLYNGLPAQTQVLADPGVRNMFGRTVYLRGGLAVHALRMEVGDDHFFQIIREYYNRYADSHASIADFTALASEVSERDLAGFFQTWLYDETLPPYPAGR